MSLDYHALKVADAALAISDPAAAATALNAQTVVGAAQNLAWSALRDVLMNNFDWGSLVAAANTAVAGLLPGGGAQTAAIQQAAIAIHECCIYGGQLNSANSTVWSALTAAAGRLVPASVGAISSASVTTITGLRTPTAPAWPKTIIADDVTAARATP